MGDTGGGPGEPGQRKQDGSSHRPPLLFCDLPQIAGAGPGLPSHRRRSAALVPGLSLVTDGQDLNSPIATALGTPASQTPESYDAPGLLGALLQGTELCFGFCCPAILMRVRGSLPPTPRPV